ncbi:uncharacterized protein LOC134245836 [Saccostrea cucullata]|uniref:uncharacterized protein LOC134245836 n=1 Tax=Saccostrea cuccullata TaxID=36930 RepID=UPI002ED4C6C7
MGIMIAVSLMFFISSSLTIASNCDHPLDFHRNGPKKIVSFENIIEKVKEALQNTNLTEAENPLISNFFSNGETSVEFKVARKGPLKICAVSLNNRKCFEIRCDCKDVPRQQGNSSHLHSSNVSLLCKATTQNDSLQDRSCQKHNTVNTTSKNETSNLHQLDVTSSNAVKTFNDQKTGSNSTTSNLMQIGNDKDVSPWFTTAVFVGGFVSGLIISMTFSYICHKRRRTGVEKEKPEYTTEQDRPLIRTQLQVADTSVYSEISEQKRNNKPLNNGNPLYSSPVYVGEYVEPVTMNGNARLFC